MSVSDYFKQRQINDIHRSSLSFNEIDDQQTEHLQILINAWAEKRIHPYAVESVLRKIIDGDIQDDDIIKLKSENHLEAEAEKMLDEYVSEDHRGDLLNPEQKEKIHSALHDIENRLIQCEINSWDATIAIAEILYAPIPPQDKEYQDYTRLENRAREFYAYAKRKQQYWHAHEGRKNLDIRKEMEPDKESDIQEYADGLLSAMKKNGDWKFMSDHKGLDLGTEDEHAQKIINALPQEIQDTLFPGGYENIWGNWNNKDPLCDALYIAPSGTGLIDIDRSYRDCVSDVYGLKVARITTYSVSLKVKDEKNIDESCRKIEIALSALKRYNDTYLSHGGGDLDENYETPCPHIKEKDGIITVLDRMHLDDLWLFYYMIEPILEANVQIATAMDIARHAEERGAPLDPDALYISNYEHDVSDEAHELKNGENTLPIALKDAFYDVAIGRINNEQFINRLIVLADHSLQGTIHDPKKLLPTYTQINENYSIEAQDGNKYILTYEDAMKDRVFNFVRVLTSNYSDDVPLPLSLTQKINAYSVTLKEQEKQTKLDKFESDHQRETEDELQRIERRRTGEEKTLSSMIEEAEFEHVHLSDAFDKLRGYKKRGEKNVKYERLNEKDDRFDDDGYETHTDVTADNGQQLVFRDSEVEACLDDMHYLGQRTDEYSEEVIHFYYRSKTKGSIHPRKTLPSKLKPFATSNDPRHGFNVLEFKPLTIK